MKEGKKKTAQNDAKLDEVINIHCDNNLIDH